MKTKHKYKDSHTLTKGTIQSQIPTQHKTTHVPQTHRHSLEASTQHTHKDTDHRTPPNHTHTQHIHVDAVRYKYTEMHRGTHITHTPSVNTQKETHTLCVTQWNYRYKINTQ